MNNRPTGRKVTHSGGGSGVHKTGSGSGGGRVGSGGHFSSHSSSHSSSGGSHSGGSHGGGFSFSSGGGTRSGGGGPGCLTILVVLVALIFGGGGLAINGISGGGDQDHQQTVQTGSGTYNGWTVEDTATGNTGDLSTDVAAQAREKFTTIKGDGTDKNTIMVYMCGTDLESRSAMGTSDLNEMISATVGNNINLIVYTGGCKQWRNNTLSSARNQVWQIKDGGIKCLIDNAGNDSMTKASTLSSFIKWTGKNFPANRMSLIFWDHGGGSVSGYGYDEKYPRSGSMTLGSIDTALKDAGLQYDFIGFDACLMATAETALVIGKYADYMIGSEETEPGIGWYYTNWLNRLSKDPGLPTLEIGKQIADDFTAQCAKRCPGQSTTLSVTDLAELTQTLPEKLDAFAEEASNKISNGHYREVATARGSSKEFARGTKIDQIDLIHFATLMNTGTGKKLAKTISDAVKYNVTSRNTANAYGLSIYFPYQSLNKVDSMTNTYEQIGMGDDYTACVRQFAQMQVSGQAVSGATGGGASPFEALMGTGSSSQDLSSQAMQQLINALMSNGFSDFRRFGLVGLDRSNTEFLRQDQIDPNAITAYVAENNLSASDFYWQKNADGKQAIILTEDQWSMIETADLNMFYDDGEGFIELGLDNIFDFDDDGNMLPKTDRSWLSINGQPVAYYHTETLDREDGTYSISGYVPITLNGKDARMILTFDSDNEEGYVAGVSYDYDEDVTQTAAKNLSGLKKGDKVKFMCDYYSYSGKFNDSYQLGSTMTVQDPDRIRITNTDVGKGGVMILYKFTDMYGQEFWTPALRQ